MPVGVGKGATIVGWNQGGHYGGEAEAVDPTESAAVSLGSRVDPGAQQEAPGRFRGRRRPHGHRRGRR
jgi:hypothetical protein